MIKVFLLAFIGGLLWYRILYALVPRYFNRPVIRSFTGLRWHHLHHGIVLVFAGVLLLALGFAMNLVMVILGVGLGFLTDEFIPVLIYETEREKELAVYRKSLGSTFIVGIAVLFVFMIFYLAQ